MTEIRNDDSVGFVIVLVTFALLLAVTCAAVAWRVAGHGPPFGTNPEPIVVPATAPDAEAVPYREEP